MVFCDACLLWYCEYFGCQPPLWERYQQICREWDQSQHSQPKLLTTGVLSGSQEKASASASGAGAADDKPPMFAFCLKPRGLELLNKGSKHRPHKKISLSGHSHAFLADHDTPTPHHASASASGKHFNIIASYFFTYFFLSHPPFIILETIFTRFFKLY